MFPSFHPSSLYFRFWNRKYIAGKNTHGRILMLKHIRWPSLRSIRILMQESLSVWSPFPRQILKLELSSLWGWALIPPIWERVPSRTIATESKAGCPASSPICRESSLPLGLVLPWVSGTTVFKSWHVQFPSRLPHFLTQFSVPFTEWFFPDCLLSYLLHVCCLDHKPY